MLPESEKRGRQQYHPFVLQESAMRNVLMIRKEPGLVTIPVEKAIYCEDCETISTSVWNRCGVCGSESIVELAPLLGGPSDPGPVPAASLAAGSRLAA